MVVSRGKLTRREFLRNAAAATAGGIALSACGARHATPKSHRLIVYGVTPSGIAAACAGARGGLEVTLVAGESPLGGMMTNGLGHSDIGDVSAIGGLAATFFRMIGSFYNSKKPIYNFEPHAATSVFTSLLASYRIGVQPGIITAVEKSGQAVTAIGLASGATVKGDLFIDASYEGSLLRLAGVTTRYGRESKAEYGESGAGFGAAIASYDVSPFESREGTRLDQNVAQDPSQRVGAGDLKTQAYTFRLCLTDRDDNKVPYIQPANYDADRYRLFADSLNTVAYLPTMTSLPNGKFDLNGGIGLFGTDYVGGSWGFPAATLAQRRAIWQQHYDYQAGFLYFLTNDPSVPTGIQSEASRYGLAADEFTGSHNWPTQLYIREGQRLVGRYVLKQADLDTSPTQPDAIGLGSYRVDCHGVQRFQPATHRGIIRIEGSIPSQLVPTRKYQIPYRCLLPRAGQARNVLASVCVSASHVAWASLRMEPQFMILGEAAGVAAALAVETASPLDKLDVDLLRTTLRKHGAAIELS